jgi:flagellar hook-length control protein FliK
VSGALSLAGLDAQLAGAVTSASGAAPASQTTQGSGQPPASTSSAQIGAVNAAGGAEQNGSTTTSGGDSGSANGNPTGASSGSSAGAASTAAIAPNLEAALSGVSSQSGGSGATASAPIVATSPLGRLADTVQLTIQTQAASGNSVVRIKLTPPELGEVRVQLQQTSAGLVARVVADHQSAVQTLQQSAGELRRALESSGVSLLQLDIGASDSQNEAASGGEESSQSTGPGTAGQDTTDEAETGETTTTTLTLTGASVVDVFA